MAYLLAHHLVKMPYRLSLGQQDMFRNRVLVCGVDKGLPHLLCTQWVIKLI